MVYLSIRSPTSTEVDSGNKKPELPAPVDFALFRGEHVEGQEKHGKVSELKHKIEDKVDSAKAKIEDMKESRRGQDSETAEQETPVDAGTAK